MKFIKVFLAMTAIMAVVLFNYCSDYEDEDFKLEGTDKSACTQFESSYQVDTVWVDSVTSTLDTSITVDDTLTTAGLADLELDTTATTGDITSALEASSKTFSPANKSYYLMLPSAENTSYYVINNDQAGKATYYFEDYIDVDFTAMDGSTVSTSDSHIESATVAYCDFIKTRNVYNLSSGKYLMTVKKDDKTQSINFLMVIKK